jgi:hypothetical protein
MEKREPVDLSARQLSLDLLADIAERAVKVRDHTSLDPIELYNDLLLVLRDRNFLVRALFKLQVTICS